MKKYEFKIYDCSDYAELWCYIDGELFDIFETTDFHDIPTEEYHHPFNWEVKNYGLSLLKDIGIL